MQAPKDPPEPQTLGDPPQSFVTGNCKKSTIEDMFARGVREGAEPYIFSVSEGIGLSGHTEEVCYSMGGARVTISCLEMIQATDPEALGFAKGRELKAAYLQRQATPVGPTGTHGEPCALIPLHQLSVVLHEMAGQASMCWDPRPLGVFDSTAAQVAVAQAIERLQAVAR